MTRINASIHPSELCDQHLVAELRELPRMAAFAKLRLTTIGLTGIPKLPTLGTGHMAFFLPYGLYLKRRHEWLRAEMGHRGFKVTEYDTDIWHDYPWQADLDDSVLAYARDLLIKRINSRLCAMKRTPTWTNRFAPTWATCAWPYRA